MGKKNSGAARKKSAKKPRQKRKIDLLRLLRRQEKGILEGTEAFPKKSFGKSRISSKAGAKGREWTRIGREAGAGTYPEKLELDEKEKSAAKGIFGFFRKGLLKPKKKGEEGEKEKIEEKKEAAIKGKKGAKPSEAEPETAQQKKASEIFGRTTKEGIIKKIDSYEFKADKIPVTVNIYLKKGLFVPEYDISISKISKTTELILEKIRNELISEVSLGIVDITDLKKTGEIERSFRETIELLIKKHFPDADDETIEFLIAFLVQRSLGLGNIEILMKDINLEEIAINRADEPVWVYHKKHGWLETNIFVDNEEQTRHYAAMIGRKVGRQISILEPLLDANLGTGDRVNATLNPISLQGNTITIRKFASKAWTITDFISNNSISREAAALIWLAVQYELSVLIAGGTASGKTSMLNVLSNFFPPNQRIISIEDTHELKLPKFLHWIPTITRLPNSEGRGGISMLDLLVNSLRMRPDRILVGEIRRQKEAEVLFEAMHTGHSVYSTVHANSAHETITRLTTPPIDIPKTLLPAISLLLVQYRNRRTGIRRTFQVAEVLPDSTPNVLIQLNLAKDKLEKSAKSVSFMKTLKLFTGMSDAEIARDLKEKEAVLDWLVKQKIDTVDEVGMVMARYYTDKAELLRIVKKGKGKVAGKSADKDEDKVSRKSTYKGESKSNGKARGKGRAVRKA